MFVGPKDPHVWTTGTFDFKGQGRVKRDSPEINKTVKDYSIFGESWTQSKLHSRPRVRDLVSRLRNVVLRFQCHSVPYWGLNGRETRWTSPFFSCGHPRTSLPAPVVPEVLTRKTTRTYRPCVSGQRPGGPPGTGRTRKEEERQ